MAVVGADTVAVVVEIGARVDNNHRHCTDYHRHITSKGGSVAAVCECVCEVSWRGARLGIMTDSEAAVLKGSSSN